MRSSPQLCLFLLAVCLMPRATLHASPLKLLPPESQDSSEHLVLRAISGLRRAHHAGPHHSARPPAPWQPPRERKAGCKTFYWKTLTSC